MGPADAIAGWVNASGMANVLDFATDANYGIVLGEVQQDAIAMSGSLDAVSGMLTITFRRALDTQVWILMCGPLGCL
jgi:hypothetical protein